MKKTLLTLLFAITMCLPAYSSENANITEIKQDTNSNTLYNIINDIQNIISKCISQDKEEELSFGVKCKFITAKLDFGDYLQENNLTESENIDIDIKADTPYDIADICSKHRLIYGKYNLLTSLAVMHDENADVYIIADETPRYSVNEVYAVNRKTGTVTRYYGTENVFYPNISSSDDIISAKLPISDAQTAKEIGKRIFKSYFADTDDFNENDLEVMQKNDNWIIYDAAPKFYKGELLDGSNAFLIFNAKTGRFVKAGFSE